MTKVNWQAYEDGSLSADEHRAVERLLETSKAAAEELAGFRAFREEIARQGLEAAVPRKDLEELLKDVVRSERRPAFSILRVAPVAAALVLFAIGLWWWKRDPMAFATTPVAATLESTSMTEAEAWIERNTGFSVPSLKLPAEATLVISRYGESKEWACVDFMHEGKLYFLYMKRDGSSLGDRPTRIFDGRGFYEGQGVGWRTSGLSYYLTGGTREGRWSFATHLAPQTAEAA